MCENCQSLARRINIKDEKIKNLKDELTRIKDRELLKSYQSRPCIICGKREEIYPHHLKTKGSGGPDAEWNLIPVCAEHHIPLFHSKPLASIADNYPSVKRFLESNGWVFNDFSKKWLYLN